MKIQIIKCSNKSLWYTCLALPAEFDVVESSVSTYTVIGLQFPGKHIFKYDCKVVENCNENKELKSRVFDSGAKRDLDNDKEDYIESISWVALKRYSKYMKTQESKYGRGNWKKGIPIEEYEKSLLRHIQKYLSNKYDGSLDEIDLDHLSAAFFNLQGLIHEIEKLKLK